MKINAFIFIADFISENVQENDVVESTYALPEKTKKGPPTNKNIPVRNMKAQIKNMSLNDNTGFKSEYHVRLFLPVCFNLFLFLFFFCNS